MTDQITNHADILNKMIEEPGMISEAYSQFHNYSLGNIMAVAIQCAALGIDFGPISNYKNWQRLGRQVQKGQKAMVILHPRQKTYTKEEQDENGEIVEKLVTFMTFTPKATAFVLSQTDGEEIDWGKFGWDKEQALSELGINELPFTNAPSGNIQGFANRDGVSVNPVAKEPMKTLAHEIAHKLMHIDSETSEIFDGEIIARSDREVEAETVAMIVVHALGFDGTAYSIGYIRNWMNEGFEYTDKMARRILSAANKILKAGRVEIEAEDTIEIIKHETQFTHEEGGVDRPSSSYSPDDFDARAVADECIEFFGLTGKLKIDVRVKDIERGRADYDHQWISIPKWAIEVGVEFANAYVAHEVCHQVAFYSRQNWLLIDGEQAVKERGGHGKQFRYLEEKVVKALWDLDIVRRRGGVYIRQLLVGGKVVYDEDK